MIAAVVVVVAAAAVVACPFVCLCLCGRGRKGRVGGGWGDDSQGRRRRSEQREREEAKGRPSNGWKSPSIITVVGYTNPHSQPSHPTTLPPPCGHAFSKKAFSPQPSRYFSRQNRAARRPGCEQDEEPTQKGDGPERLWWWLMARSLLPACLMKAHLALSPHPSFPFLLVLLTLTRPVPRLAWRGQAPLPSPPPPQPQKPTSKARKNA